MVMFLKDFSGALAKEATLAGPATETLSPWHLAGKAKVILFDGLSLGVGHSVSQVLLGGPQIPLWWPGSRAGMRVLRPVVVPWPHGPLGKGQPPLGNEMCSPLSVPLGCGAAA